MFLDSYKVKTIATFCLAMFLVLGVVVPVFAEPVVSDPADPFGLVGVNTEGTFGTKDLKATVGSIIKVALSFLGVVAIVIVLIGGFKYMTAGGSDEKTGDAKKYIISGIIGLAIILSAYAITTFVLSSLQGATVEE